MKNCSKYRLHGYTRGSTFLSSGLLSRQELPAWNHGTQQWTCASNWEKKVVGFGAKVTCRLQVDKLSCGFTGDSSQLRLCLHPLLNAFGQYEDVPYQVGSAIGKTVTAHCIGIADALLPDRLIIIFYCMLGGRRLRCSSGAKLHVWMPHTCCNTPCHM